MDLSDEDLRKKIENFKETITADLYSSTDFIDFDQSSEALADFKPELAALDRIIKQKHVDETDFGHLLLRYPRLYAFLCSLLAISGSVAFADGRRLPGPGSPALDLEGATAAAKLLLELGLARLFESGFDSATAFSLVQIATDAQKRRFRVDQRIKAKVKSAITAAIEQFNRKHGSRLALVPEPELPPEVRRKTEYLVSFDEKPRVAIATTFQTYSGGRQSREFSTLYPSIKSSLVSRGLAFVLIADGQGVKNLPERVLRNLFVEIPNTFSLAQAEFGALAKSLEDTVFSPEEVPVDNASVSRLIASALDSIDGAQSSFLPLPEAQARLALASFAAKNSNLDLDLAKDGTKLNWRKSDVFKFRRLKADFDEAAAIQSWVDLMEGTFVASPAKGDIDFCIAEIEGDPLILGPFMVSAMKGHPTPTLLKEVAKHALQIAPDSRVAFLLVPSAPKELLWGDLRDVQAFLPVTIVVVDINTVLSIAQSSEPVRERIRALMLEQTDLTKLSPFVVRGVTPSRVFFGREEEEATLLSTLSTNSVAILGGRRIGKTSLMRHSFERLRAANLQPFFGDCQVVRTWADFGEMAARNWSVKLPAEFRPHYLEDMVKSLDDGSGRPIVIMLDEIDQLLDWDKKHSEDEVPEAFFRACRAISQQGLAQFVFSGERTIAQRLWDTTSPHWNFCRPLLLRQLTRSAAASLITEPLESLGVQIDDLVAFADATWTSSDGHPELIQFIGDGVVSLINGRGREEVYSDADDVRSVVNQFAYAEQYLETYWGQANALERVITLMLVNDVKSVDQLLAASTMINPRIQSGDVMAALRMLDLYGIAAQADDGYELRSLWFRSALSFYGGPEMMQSQYSRALTND